MLGEDIKQQMPVTLMLSSPYIPRLKKHCDEHVCLAASDSSPLKEAVTFTFPLSVHFVFFKGVETASPWLTAGRPL